MLSGSLPVGMYIVLGLVSVLSVALGMRFFGGPPEQNV
jgi:hypothetical protein